MKITITRAFAALLLIAGVASTTGCEKNPVDKTVYAIKLDVKSKTLTFDDNGWTTQVCELIIEPGDAHWEIGSAPEWLTVVPEDSKIAVTAQAYANFRNRSGKIVIKSGNKTAEIEVTQTKSTPKIEDIPALSLPATDVSPNGRYVIGTRASQSFAYDRETGDLLMLGSGKGFANPPELSSGLVSLYGVSNNGIVVGTASQPVDSTPDDPDDIISLPFSFDVGSKAFTWLRVTGPEIEAVTEKIPSSSVAWAISADGTTISGYLGLPATAGYEGIELNYLPVVWKDQQIIVLKHDQNGLGLNSNAYGYQPRFMSDDGKVIAGYIVPQLPRYVGVHWNVDQPDVTNFVLRDDPSYFASEDLGASKVPSKYFRPYKISGDGKIITGSVEDFTSDSVMPINYNIETGEVTVASEAKGTTGRFTLPDGTMACLPDAVATVFYKDGTITGMRDWFNKNHGLDVESNSYMMQDASTTGKVMVGAYVVGSNFQPFLISL